MNLDRASGTALVQALVAKGLDETVDVAVCPPYVYLESIGSALSGTAIKLGAQNASDQPSGAFTGEISCAMLLDVGCSHVILGHSERRQLMGETDEVVNRKVLAALEAGLAPIVCVGETLEERESGQTLDVIQSQFRGSLAGVSTEQMQSVTIAYEPVWAIGTGKVATPEQAEEVHADLRKLLETAYNGEIAANVRIQYGGSVKPDNAGELMAQPNIDGALVGGASLKADDFAAIVTAAKN